jgi:hypothetical protein
MRRFPADRLDRVRDVAELFPPRSFQESAALVQIVTFLDAWEADARQERVLRGRCAWMIFVLAAFQTLAGAALLYGIGTKAIIVDVQFLKILFSALLTEFLVCFYW